MTIAYSFQIQGKLLEVTASGADDSFDEVQAYGLAIMEKAIAHQCTQVLCDERQLEYRLNTVDTYELAAFIAEAAPKVGRIALVCRKENSQDARFWEDVVVNRGLSARIFEDIELARQWLADGGWSAP